MKKIVDEVNAMNIGQRIHNIIDDRDIKQKTLAKRLGIPLSTLNGYMTGRNQFPCDILPKIAQELHVTTDYLLELTDHMEPPFSLSGAECRMVEQFRTLTAEQRELIVQNIRLMQEQNRR